MCAPPKGGHAGKVDGNWSGLCALLRVVIGPSKTKDGALPV